MFGLYRTGLALWVMIFHLLDIPVIGPYAVFSFFALSGFLMTTIMHDTYGYNISGIKRYVINRFLRLYPMYWMVAVVSILAIMFVSKQYSINYKDVLYIPEAIISIIFNGIMIFPSLIPYDIGPRLSPPTWALSIEIFFYICIALGVSRTKEVTQTWVGLSAFYVVLSYVIGLSGPHRYASIFAASLPFSLGSLLFFYKKEILLFIKNYRIMHPVAIVCIYILHAAIFTIHAHYYPFINSYYISEFGRYSNIIITLLTIMSLYYRGEEIFSKKLDKVAGDYSYPIYLLHWQCGLVASYFLFDSPTRGMSKEGGVVFLCALLIVFGLSFFLIQIVDKNIALVRERVKANTRR